MPAPKRLNAASEIRRLLTEESIAPTPGVALSSGPTFPPADTAVHDLDGEFHADASDTTDLDATVAHHGLLPKLSGDVDEALRGDGSWGLVTGGGGGGAVTLETPVGTIDGANAAFTLSAAPASPAELLLFKNGILQREGSGNDFTLSGATITYESGNLPQTGDSHQAAILAVGAGMGALDDLTDVNAPAPADEDVLTFDTGTGEWIAAPAPGGGAGLNWEAYLATLSGLVHRWKFEEASGNFADAVGSLALVPSGTVSYHNAGLVGTYAAGFSSGGYARSSGLGSIPVGANPRTIITIYRTSGVQTGKSALNSYGPTGSTRQWWMAGINESAAWTSELDLWGDDLVGDLAGAGDGNWHMHAAGHDGDRMAFTYIDGRISYRNIGGALATGSGGDFTVAQTSDIGTASLPLTGFLDDMLVFNVMLNKAQLDQLFLRIGGAL